MPDVEHKKCGAVMTPELAFVVVKDYIAYIGTYTVDESAGTVNGRVSCVVSARPCSRGR